LQEPYEEIQANRGRLLVGQGRWEEALPLLEETLRSEKGKPGEFYYNLGYSTLWPKNGTNQQNDFEKPFAEAIYGELARSYNGLGMKQQAIHYAKLAASTEG
jgi:tetratricopeptide (TPR) repeat protein